VGTLKGQGGADLSALRGVSVPVRLSGPFAKPAYTVLWSEAAGNLLRGTIKSKVQEELKKQLGPEPGKTLPGLFKDLLR
jgi:AsmA protein